MTDEREAANPVDEFFVKAHKALLFDTSLSANDLRVYLGFRHFARPEQGKMTVWPSIKTLANTLNLSTRQVDRSIATLAEKGLIERKQTKSTALTTLTRMSCVYENLDHVPHKAKTDSGVSRHANVAGLDTPPAADRSRCSEGDNGPADKPRVSVTENPTQRPLPKARELTYEAAPETEPYNPLARPKKTPNPRRLKEGKEANRLYDKYIASKGFGPPVSDQTIPTLVKAGKRVYALKDSLYAGKALEELMPLLVARVKSADAFWRAKVGFHWLFVADAPNLVRMLNGEFGREAFEPEKPKRREIPAEDVWPGMDEAAYWREKDKEAGHG